MRSDLIEGRPRVEAAHCDGVVWTWNFANVQGAVAYKGCTCVHLGPSQCYHVTYLLAISSALHSAWR